jgi:hypothetical protein
MKAVLKTSIVTFVLGGFLVLGLAFLMVPAAAEAKQLSQETAREFLAREGILLQLATLDARAPAVKSQSPKITSEQAIALAIQGEIGTNDFRLSDMGGDMLYDALRPAVAYNSTLDEYLVVWEGDDNVSTLEDEEFEIFGQRIAGATGAEIGDLIRLSDMGPDGDPEYDALNPAVVYNPTQEEYLVVWEGDDNTGSLMDGEFEIFSQRIVGATGAKIGGDVRLSDMGPDGDPEYGAFNPAVAYNPIEDAYVVVWHGDDDDGSLMDNELEIFGQRVAGATGMEIGGDVRLSDMGPDGDPDYDAFSPAVAYNPTQDAYLVVWSGEDDTGLLVDNEAEIFGQLVQAATGVEIGGDLRLSDMGQDGNPDYSATNPAVAYNPTQGEYLVVWEGVDDTGLLVSGEFEIFGQRVAGATGAEIGGDFRLSDMGPDGDPDYDTFDPAVAYNPTQNEYLVVWRGDDNTSSLVEGEFEMFGQRVAGATGAEIGGDVRLSDMGPDGDPDYDVDDPALAYNPTQGEYLVVWEGDDNSGSLVDGEFEIFAQRLTGATGAEIGSDARLSEMGTDKLYDAFDPAVAYNPTQNEYLVVWQGDDNTSPLVENEFEIFGQRVEADTGTVIGGDIRLSDMGPDGNLGYGAFSPAVVYNPIQGEYLVVWEGNDNTGSLADGEFEIYGQRVAGSTGAEIGEDVRLSDMGPDGDQLYIAFNPAVAYNPTQNDYLVVWEGNDDTGSLTVVETEIFGQRVAGDTGAEIGGDLRLSDMGPAGFPDYGAFDPALAYNPTQNEYLVVWWGDDNTGSLEVNEFEIFGQLVEADTGAEIGGDFRLSDMGPDRDILYSAVNPAVAYNPSQGEYLVVWEGDDNIGPLVNNENEIYGQRVAGATGAEIGGDTRFSFMGPDGDPDYDAQSPAVAYDPTQGTYLVVWSGDDNTVPLVNNEYEIYGQLVDALTGAKIGSDLRLSDMGSDGETVYGASAPAVAYNFTQGEYLVVWQGSDDTGSLVAGEFEIFGQRLSSGFNLYLPLIRRE